MENNYYTQGVYQKNSEFDISPTMEDYLEMLCRATAPPRKSYIRINKLADSLNVKPPAASKMIMKLKEKGYVNFEPYGEISLTEKGVAVSAYLLHRHQVLNRFFSKINATESELELVERIEHFIDSRTLQNIEKLLNNGLEL